MATQDVEVELQEVRIDMSAADPGPRGRTPDDDNTVGESDIPAVDPSGHTPDDDNTVGGPDIHVPAVDPSGHTPEHVLEKLQLYNSDDVVNQYLPELVKLLQDDNTAAANSALCYAARVGSIPMMDTLIQKGADINAKSRICMHFKNWREGTPLHVAARRCKVDAVAFLVDKGADVNIKDEDGDTPLHIARHCKEVGKCLVDHGADVNMKDKEGNTPLHLAARYMYLDTVTYLIGKGADVNIRNHLGSTPLHLATKHHHKEVEKYLVDHGADVNIKDNEGNTPLHLAAKGRLDAVTYLVGKGADVNIRNYLGSTPLHIATMEDSNDIVKFLVDHGADVNAKNGKDVLEDLKKAIQDGDVQSFNQRLSQVEEFFQDQDNAVRGLAAIGALCYAAEVGSIPMMDTLIQKGVDINTKSNYDHSEWTPLHVAAYRGNVDAVAFLVDKGADINIKDDHRHRTPMCLAARKGNVDTVRYLCDKGADLNIKDDWGMSPLYVAAESNNVDTVRYLSDKGADLNIKDNDGRTPLHALVGNDEDNVDSMRLLIYKGADMNIKDEEWGNTPLHLAAKEGYHNAVTCLVDEGAGVNIRNHWGRTPLHMAAEKEHEDIEEYLTDHGADVNIKDGVDVLKDLKEAIKKGDLELFRQQLSQIEEIFLNCEYIAMGIAAISALCYAAEVGSIPMMDTLIQKGADVDNRIVVYEIWDESQESAPLLEAAKSGKFDAVKYLVEKGADVNIESRYSGETPLHGAAWSGNIDMVRYLGDKGADFNVKDTDGGTPLHRACGNGSTEVVKYLLEKGLDPADKSKYGHNSLFFAIWSRHKDVTTFLLCLDEWKEMLKSSLQDSTLMRELIVSMPDVAEVAFNRCITTNEGTDDVWGNEVHATSDTFKVDFNYEFLEDFQDKHSSDSDDSWRPKKFMKQHHTLNLIRQYDCSNLLKHPLVISLLEHKWTRFGRYIFFGNLFIYLIFLAFLTAFGLVVLSPLEKTCVDVLNGSFNGTAPENCEGLSIHEYRFLYVGAAVTILTALFRLATEIFQLCRHPLEYLQDWVNWLEIPLYLFSIIFTFVFATPCLCVYSWQWQIGVVAVFLGWVGLITFLQKWPVTGVYVLMFVNILGSFMKIAFLALLLVIAFALAFYMLLFEPDEMRTAFSHPGRAIVKVMAMTTGELDYDELYHQQEGEDEVAFPPVSFLLWIIFLVLMPVLLSNLLVGLAVGDVDRLQKTASENRIGLQIDLVLNFEELLESMGIRHRFVIEESEDNYPNVPATLLPEWCKMGTDDYYLIHYPEDHKLQTKMGKWYSKLWITDEYSTSGVKISDAIKAPPKSLENLLQMQRQQLEAKLQEHGGLKSQHLEAKLNEQSEHQSQELEAKLKENNAKQSEQLEAKLKEQSEQLKEAVRQLSECHKEQAKKMEEKTEQLAGEVASLREALEKFVTQMAAK